jgi:hypothetical protein
MTDIDPFNLPDAITAIREEYDMTTDSTDAEGIA